MPLQKVQADPRLEIIRKEGLEEPAPEYNVKDLIEKTRRIHAGWLFDYDYALLRQKLCRFLDGIPDTLNTPGWGTFGHYLGLENEVLKVIQFGRVGDEGYTYYVLLHYIQKSDATIHKIIAGLQTLKRFDVLNETHSYFSELADNVLGSEVHQRSEDLHSGQENNQDSGFCSDSYDEINQESRQETRELNSESSIIRPNFIPKPPLVLLYIEKKPVRTIPSNVPSCETEINQLQTTDSLRTAPGTSVVPIEKPIPKKYDCIAFLTFANDGIRYVDKVAAILRNGSDGQQIGVLILEEHRETVESNPVLFIDGAFPQADYVVPIITEEYLKGVNTLKVPENNEVSFIDCKYVRFIYSLMKDNYVRKGCLNKKVRCVIPDNLQHLSRKAHKIDSIFDSWVPLSGTDKLAKRMLARCERKKYNK